MVTREIKLKIHEEADMFTPFDPERKLLSEDVAAYLVRNYENVHRRAFESLAVHVYSDTPVNEERVKHAIRDHCEQRMKNIDHALKLETLKEISLAVLGLMLLSLWFLLSRTYDNIWMEVLSIMGWVALWEATSILVMRRPELHLLKKTYKKAYNAEITVETAEEEV